MFTTQRSKKLNLNGLNALVDLPYKLPRNIEKELISLDALKMQKMVISKVDDILSSRYSFYQGSSLYENWFPGKILEYKYIFGLKRFLDDFDYIRLINDKVKY